MSIAGSFSSRLNRAAKTRASSDALAEEYAKHICDELDHRPLERDLLERFTQQCGLRGFTRIYLGSKNRLIRAGSRVRAHTRITAVATRSAKTLKTRAG